MGAPRYEAGPMRDVFGMLAWNAAANLRRGVGSVEYVLTLPTRDPALALLAYAHVTLRNERCAHGRATLDARSRRRVGTVLK